jgi:hypothetical protein
MKVICISNLYYPLSLSLNKEYQVFREKEFFYSILDDNLEEYFFPKNLFKVIENI